VGACVALLSAPAIASAPQSLTFFRYAGDAHELQDALDCAIARWRQATCLPIDISYAAAHLVRLKPADQMNGKAANTGGASWNAARITIADTFAQSPEWMCSLLMHEMRHVLARDNGHPGQLGSFSYPTTGTGSKITTDDLESVCEKQTCGCQVPETAGQPPTP